MNKIESGEITITMSRPKITCGTPYYYRKCWDICYKGKFPCKEHSDHGTHKLSLGTTKYVEQLAKQGDPDAIKAISMREISNDKWIKYVRKIAKKNMSSEESGVRKPRHVRKTRIEVRKTTWSRRKEGHRENPIVVESPTDVIRIRLKSGKTMLLIGDELYSQDATGTFVMA